MSDFDSSKVIIAVTFWWNQYLWYIILFFPVWKCWSLWDAYKPTCFYFVILFLSLIKIQTLSDNFIPVYFYLRILLLLDHNDIFEPGCSNSKILNSFNTSCKLRCCSPGNCFYKQHRLGSKMYKCLRETNLNRPTLVTCNRQGRLSKVL